MGATEIVQAMVSPAEKLIEAVSGAIGKAYEPRHVRKMAEAIVMSPLYMIPLEFL